MWGGQRAGAAGRRRASGPAGQAGAGASCLRRRAGAWKGRPEPGAEERGRGGVMGAPRRSPIQPRPVELLCRAGPPLPACSCRARRQRPGFLACSSHPESRIFSQDTHLGLEVSLSPSGSQRRAEMAFSSQLACDFCFCSCARRAELAWPVHTSSPPHELGKNCGCAFLHHSGATRRRITTPDARA